MKTGISVSMSPAVVFFKFDPFTKNSRMFLLRESGLSLANMEMFMLKIDSGNLREYTKLVNMQRDWLNVDNPDVSVCQHDFLTKYNQSLFEQDFFVVKKSKKHKQGKTISRAEHLVKQANSSNHISTLINQRRSSTQVYFHHGGFLQLCEM